MSRLYIILFLLTLPLLLWAQDVKTICEKAEKGDSYAQLEYAKKLLESGNSEEAEKWLLCAAEQNNEMAQTFLGVYYEMFCEDYKEAMKWFLKAGEQGNGEAFYTVGDFYAEGKGVKKDINRAFYYYERSAECGYSNGMNMMALAFLYGGIEEYVVERDVYKAVDYFKVSAELGNVAGQRWLGICYLEGIGIEQNRNEAIKWLNKATEQGDEESKNILEKL